MKCYICGKEAVGTVVTQAIHGSHGQYTTISEGRCKKQLYYDEDEREIIKIDGKKW